MVVAGKKNGRYMPPVPIFRAGVLGVLQQAVPVGFFLIAFCIREHAGHQAAHGVGQGHGRNFAAGQHKVAHGNFFVHAFLNKPLIDTLVVTAYQHQTVIVCGQALGCGLTESFAAGGKIDGMEPLAGFVADMLPALVQGIGLHYRAPPAAIGIIVHLLLFI